MTRMNACSQKNRTYLTIGQDLFSIDQYHRSIYNYSLHQDMLSRESSSPSKTANRSRPVLFHPFRRAAAAYYMVYSDIQKVLGLDIPIDYGSGIEYADGLLLTSGGKPPGTGLQIGLWLNGTRGCNDIVQGNLDTQIQYLMNYLGDGTSSETSIFLRIGYEFDNPGFGYSDSPVAYRQAFRYIVSRIRSKVVPSSKIQMVWHSWAAGVPNGWALEDFYPGDAFVDWIGMSVFTQLYENSAIGNRSTVQEVIDFANDHSKPIMIAESTPFGGIDAMRDPWERWFEPVLELIEAHDIGMWSYINCDWRDQPMWHTSDFGDSRLSTNATVLRLWNERILGMNNGSSRFLLYPCNAGDPELRSHSIVLWDGSSLTSWLGAVITLLALFLFASCCWRPDFQIISSHSDGPNVGQRRPRGYGTI